MKKLFLTTFLMSCFFIKAQQTSCNYQVPANFYTATTGYSKQARALVPSDACLVFNVKFHYVLGSLGENQDNINEDRLLKIIQTANLKFNQFRIYFKYRGNDHINDDSFVNVTSIDATRNKFIQEGLYDYSAINIFFIRGTNNGSVSWGDLFITPILPHSSLDDYQIPHEMGHVLGLTHLESGGAAVTFTDNLPVCIANAQYSFQQVMSKPANFNPNTENVTRTPGTNYNATTAGDLVVDTHACFDKFTFNYCKPSGPPNTNDLMQFNEDSRVVDPTGETYKNLTVEKRNYMIASQTDFHNNFTPGQGIRMRETVLNSIYSTNFHQKLNLLPDDSADVSVLFEPYETTIVPGVVVSTTDLGNGNAEVCSTRLEQHKFQPGFDYFFPQNTGTNPINVSSTTFPVPPVKQGYNYPLTISQLNQGCGGDGVVEIICTRGLICTEEPFTSGIIISTRDLMSLNVNIEELDTIRVKDPQLYDSLMKEYYYKLQKTTESGAKVETVFYKQ